MPAKNFERVFRFFQFQDPSGQSIWLPLVEVTLITSQNTRVLLSLLFDTGATVTTLRAELYPMLGLQSWDQGQRVSVATAGTVVDAYQYTFTLEIFDKTVDCPINLIQMPPNPLFHGLLGRDTGFTEFGFGFWENTHELFVTTSP